MNRIADARSAASRAALQSAFPVFFAGARNAPRASAPLRRDRDQAEGAGLGRAGVRTARGAAPHGQPGLSRHPLSGALWRIGNGHARQRRARRRARPFDVYRRLLHGPRSHRHGLGACLQVRERSAEGQMDAAHHFRRGHHCGRGDRAGCRLRCEGHPHFRAARRRQLRDRRHQNVHHQRRLRRSLLRRRQDRPGRSAEPLGDHVPG